MTERNELAEKLELIGRMLEIDGMTELLGKFQPGMSNVAANAAVIRIESLLMKKDQDLSDKLIAASLNMKPEEIAKMDDAEYANALKIAVTRDALGFFASSPRTDGKK